MSFETITKKDAARRQLETAIQLYIDDKDSISIHTLTAAAFGIIRDVHKDHHYLKQAHSAVTQVMHFTFLQQNKEVLVDYKSKLFSIVRNSQKKYRMAGSNQQKRNQAEMDTIIFVDEFLESNGLSAPPGFRNSFTTFVTNSLKDNPDVLDPIESIVQGFIDNQLIDPIYRKEIINKIREAQNFFKHARYEPEKSLTFEEKNWQMLLYFSCEYYMDIFKHYPLIFSAYISWFKMKNPNYFIKQDDLMIIEAAKVLGVENMTKKQFFENFSIKPKTGKL